MKAMAGADVWRVWIREGICPEVALADWCISLGHNCKNRSGFCLRFDCITVAISRLFNVLDSDHFKNAMPEWKGYVSADKMKAGQMCHKESGFIQELCQTVSLNERQNTWIDGSLQDHEWWSAWMRGIRGKYPCMELLAFHICALLH